ncbi:MAG TPA: Pvc16 family protein [Blastocatellia bacterium]|nr:Pvc16 family protein [Blastocatellia bacterium]
MIRDLSETLRVVLDDEALKTSFKDLFDAQVSFDRPDESFNPSQTTVNLFLYDVREDMELRSNEPVITRQNGQAEIRRPPLRVRCSYLITAWPVGGTDLPLQEHRLLSQALQVFAAIPKIPEKYLQGKLKGQQPPLPMVTARADVMRNAHDFWTGVGNKLRTSITITVTIGMEIFEPETAPVAISHEMRLGERTAANEIQIKPATRQTSFSVIGQVTGADNEPVKQAAVTLLETGVTALTDDNGIYHLGAAAAGDYTLRARSGATTKDVTITIPAQSGNNYDVRL